MDWLNKILGSKGNPTAIHELTEFNYIARRLARDLPVNDGGRIVILASSCRAEVHTAITMNIASALCREEDVSVALVDATLAFTESGLSALYAGPADLGFAELLDAPADTVIALKALPHAAGLTFLPAGKGTLPPRSISAARATAAIARLRDTADYVLLVQGDMAQDPRYLAFADNADLVLITVEETVTPLTSVAATVGHLAEYRSCSVGLVVSVPAVSAAA